MHARHVYLVMAQKEWGPISAAITASIIYQFPKKISPKYSDENLQLMSLWPMITNWSITLRRVAK